MGPFDVVAAATAGGLPRSYVGSRIQRIGSEGPMTEPVSFPGVLKMGISGVAAAILLSAQVKSVAPPSTAPAARLSQTASQRQFLDRYCATCHNEQLKSGGLSLVHVDLSRPGSQPG